MDLNIDGLVFSFPAGWKAEKYDEWTYYSRKLKSIRQIRGSGPGMKAVDVIAVSSNHYTPNSQPSAKSQTRSNNAVHNQLYFIEVKDYRNPRAKRANSDDLVSDIVGKFLDTLSALRPASLHAEVQLEKEFASMCMMSHGLSLILHCETPEDDQWRIWLADLKQKLRQKLYALDPNMQITTMAQSNLLWSVTDE